MEGFRRLEDIIFKDHKELANVLYRDACRAVILKDQKIILLKSKSFGEYIIPGGGVNPNESHFEALIREVLEESGVKIKNPKPFCMITEFCPPMEKEYDLFVMKSYVYICDIESENHDTNMESYEIEYGYEKYLVDLNEAIENNHKLFDKGKPRWLYRETAILEAVKDYLKQKEQ